MNKVTELQCEKARRDCYENNIQPILAELKKMNAKFDNVMPTVKEINDFKTFFRIGKSVGIGTAVFITTIGIILGGIYAIKEWIKK